MTPSSIDQVFHQLIATVDPLALHDYPPRLAATERLLNRGAELVCWVLKQMPKLEVRFSQVLRCDVIRNLIR